MFDSVIQKYKNTTNLFLSSVEINRETFSLLEKEIKQPNVPLRDLLEILTGYTFYDWSRGISLPKNIQANLFNLFSHYRSFPNNVFFFYTHLMKAALQNPELSLIARAFKETSLKVERFEYFKAAGFYPDYFHNGIIFNDPVLIYHNNDLTVDYVESNSINLTTERFCLKGVNYVHSEIKTAKFNSKKIEYINNGIDTEAEFKKKIKDIAFLSTYLSPIQKKLLIDINSNYFDFYCNRNQIT